jgi:hypothetical protein
VAGCGQPQPAAGKQAILQDVAMIEHHPLGQAGGAAGELDIDRAEVIEALRG